MSTPEILYYVIIGILILDYMFDRILDYLNVKYMKFELPDELKGIYDEKDYRRSQAYEIENKKVGLVTTTIYLTLVLLFLLFDGFAFVDRSVRNITSNQILVPVLFFGILMLALDLINTPFSAYETFVVEEKYGFNKTTWKTFIADKLKGWMLGALLGGGLLALIVWFYFQTREMFWIYAWTLITVFGIFMTMFYTQWILPLFNKLTPLQDGPLKSKILELGNKTGFRLKDIYLMDGSRRSTKGNAFFSGLGRKKKIVLFDTLVDDLNVPETVSVLAHEIGHYKKKHTLVNLGLSVVQTGIALYILSLFIDNPVLSHALGVRMSSFHIGLVTFGLLYSPISTILGIGMNRISRKFEFTADKFAGEYNLSNSLINALKKLSVKNLSNLTPHPLYVFVNHSHPPLLSRIRALRDSPNESVAE